MFPEQPHHKDVGKPGYAGAQARALTGARSVTTRMFTRAEQADQHCQMGNLELACEVLTTWLRRAEEDAEPPGPLPRP